MSRPRVESSRVELGRRGLSLRMEGQSQGRKGVDLESSSEEGDRLYGWVELSMGNGFD